MGKIHILAMCIFLFLTACHRNKERKNNNNNESIPNGPALFVKYGCFVCHSMGGDVKYGPPLNNFYMKKVKVIRKGKVSTKVADRKYVEKAIADPRYEYVFEYRNKAMPQTFLSKEEVDALVDYIISVNENNQGPN